MSFLKKLNKKLRIKFFLAFFKKAIVYINGKLQWNELQLRWGLL